MTHSRKFPFWPTVLFVLGIAGNVALYLTRDKRDTYYPATYKTLYVPADVPALAGTRIIERGRVELIVPSKTAYDSWKVTDDTGDEEGKVHGSWAPVASAQKGGRARYP